VTHFAEWLIAEAAAMTAREGDAVRKPRGDKK